MSRRSHPRIRFRNASTRLFTVATAALAFAACADGTGPRGQRVSISMATPAVARTAASGALASVAAPNGAPVTANGHTLALNAMDLTIGDLRLRRAGHDLADDHGADDENDVLFARGPMTIPLPLDGGIVTLAAQALPAGTFSAIEAELESVHLAGSYDGVSFDVPVELSHDMKLALNPPLTTNGGADQNVTVSIDLSSCFESATGTPVDPRTLVSGGSEARRAFRDCVANRLRAFEDRNRDGRDDDHGAEGGDRHGSDG